MKLKSLLFLFLGTFFFFSCKSEVSNSNDDSSQSIDYEKASQQICDCVAPLTEINKEMEFLIKSGRKDEALTLLSELDARTEKTQKCMEDLNNQNRGNPLVESQKIKSLLEKKCPRTAAYLDEI